MNDKTYTVGTDCKHVEVKEDKMEPKHINILKEGWNAFHKWGMWAIIMILIGVWAGVTASKIYYNNKMDDCIKVQGIVFKEKVYSIIPK